MGTFTDGVCNYIIVIMNVHCTQCIKVSYFDPPELTKEYGGTYLITIWWVFNNIMTAGLCHIYDGIPKTYQRSVHKHTILLIWKHFRYIDPHEGFTRELICPVRAEIQAT